jgi:uncharacterized cupredoxin-like copper-binding protein
MKSHFSKILLPAIACFLIANAAVSASERVQLFVKEVPLKVLGKEATVIAIEQADGTHGYSPENYFLESPLGGSAVFPDLFPQR